MRIRETGNPGTHQTVRPIYVMLGIPSRLILAGDHEHRHPQGLSGAGVDRARPPLTPGLATERADHLPAVGIDGMGTHQASSQVGLCRDEGDQRIRLRWRHGFARWRRGRNPPPSGGETPPDRVATNRAETTIEQMSAYFGEHLKNAGAGPGSTLASFASSPVVLDVQLSSQTHSVRKSAQLPAGGVTADGTNPTGHSLPDVYVAGHDDEGLRRAGRDVREPPTVMLRPLPFEYLPYPQVRQRALMT